MEGTVYAAFAEVARRQPGAPAVIEEGRTMTFGELSAMVDIAAGTFQEGVASIGIVLGHRSEMVAAMLAALKCGARYVPAEPDFPAGRVKFMMEEAGVDFVLTEKQYGGRLAALPTRFMDCEVCGLPAPARARPDASRPGGAAYVLYTSGTTGRPKGVCVTNANVCHYARAFAGEFHPGPGDVMLQYSVCSFDIFVEEVFGALLNGAAIAIPPAEAKDDLEALMGFVGRHGVTIISGFPYLLARLNHLPGLPPSLRLLISGGDVLRGAYVDRLLGQCEVYNTYGPSETTVCATYYRCNGGTVLADGTYPIGHPVRGAQVRVLGRDGREVARGETGEICISGGGVSEGYIGDHGDENKAFGRGLDGGRLYHSGDLGYVLPGGDLAFLHRADSQIMIYGKRVEVSEVESVLYRCRGVDSAVVRAFNDDCGLAYMIAYVVPSGGRLSVSEVRAELAENLTPFMIPEFIVQMPRIPLNANGKPDSSRLPVVLKAGAL